jgi:DNA-binding NarL/FixJ family response regulator
VISSVFPPGSKALDEYVFGALKAGASGFLLKDTPPTDLLAGIATVAAEEVLLSPSVTPPADRGVRAPPAGRPPGRAHPGRAHRPRAGGAYESGLVTPGAGTG